MHIQARRLALVAAILGFGLGSGGRAEAGAILPTPPGIGPGEHFRFAIVSDGATTGASSDIAGYNSFVNSDANGATYNGSVVSWFAVASTDSVRAIDNVGQSQDPVYLVDGTQVTSSTTASGLWSGTLLHPIDMDINGSVRPAGDVWTGTSPGGTGTAGFTLGNATGLAEVGSSGLSDDRWVAIGSDTERSSHPLYAISQDLVASGLVIPEPASLWMLGIACSAGLAVALSRHRAGRQ